MLTTLPNLIEGKRIKLERLQFKHAQDLKTSCGHPRVWRYQFESWKRLLDGGVDSVVHYLVDKAAKGDSSAYAITESGNPVGIIACARDESEAVLISTWMGIPWFGAGVNTEAKLLLLKSVFAEGASIVQFKVDCENGRAIHALLKFGIHSKQLIPGHWSRGGITTDVILFELRRDDWPKVENKLVMSLSGR